MTVGAPQRLRADAAANRDRLLAAAAATMLREGHGVPLARIAEEASVGVATLYRRFPDRDALLDALQLRSYELVIAVLDEVLATDPSGIEGVRRFLESAFTLRGQLVLPLHGAGPSNAVAVVAAAGAVRDRIAAIVERGRRDGTLRPDVSGRTVVEFSALLIEGLPNTPMWERSAAQQREVFLRGIAR